MGENWKLNDIPSSVEAVANHKDRSRRRLIAVAQAVFVTVLWASSWVIIKIGLEQESLPPLTFAGLRYVIASIILMTVILFRKEHRKSARSLTKRWWGILVVYGIVFISITQGSQFAGLFFLERAITVSILLNLTPIIVLVIGSISIREKPPFIQTMLILFGVLGAMVYFYPFNLFEENLLGIVIVLVGVLTNAISSLMGRYINREQVTNPLVVTGISMTAGSVLLLGFGLMLEQTSHLSILAVFYILWLSLVNTAFAFTLWNKAMQTLRAVDMTIINSTMLPQIALLSVVFLGESPSPLNWIGLSILALSIAGVQISQARREIMHSSSA